MMNYSPTGSLITVAEQYCMPLITSQTQGMFRPESKPGSWVYLRSQGVDAIRFTLTDPTKGVGTLRIAFLRKRAWNPKKPQVDMTSVYDYYGVPESVYLEMFFSDAPMRFVNNFIKDKFQYKRISVEEAQKENEAIAISNMDIDEQSVRAIDIELPDTDEPLLPDPS